MEKRCSKVSIRRCGGNASVGARRYSVELPISWVKAIGISPEERSLEISFDGSVISLRKMPVLNETPGQEPCGSK